MSLRPLDEIGEEMLQLELTQRERRRAAGRCDYCDQPPQSRPCKFPRRHADPRIVRPIQAGLPLEARAGDVVVFNHSKNGPRYHVTLHGKHPQPGAGMFVELEELPGQFAPHLFTVIKP